MLRSNIRFGNQALSRKCLQTSVRRCYATVENRLPPVNIATGESAHGFTLRRQKEIPELQLEAYEFQHDKTGAEYLHVARDDTNNVFSIGFKTNPPDATGVPHILEHTTLCGSVRYPVRDPFFKMLTRSLSNFMNAMTSSDYTTYPFATTNKRDYENLMDVYLDATLKPLLKKDDFKQEGWRLGPADPEDTSSPIVFKGVVYNEMKGQMSDSSYLFYIRFQDHIFPSINNSGGDPAKITDLTHTQLRKFHQDHYHPSNAKVFSYGNFPVTDTLRLLNNKFSGFDKRQPDRTLKEPIDFTESKHVVVPGPLDPLSDRDRQNKTSVSWSMGESTDIYESFALQIMTSLLTDGFGSPFYTGLIDSRLGTEYTPNTGYDGSSKKAIFSVGVQGVSADDVRSIPRKINEILKEVKQKGFEDQKVQGVLHQLEIALKHKTAKFGLGLMHRLQPRWFNGVDPFDALKWNEVVDHFKTEYQKGGYLEGLLEKYLIATNSMVFTMTPSASFEAELATEEAKRLELELAKGAENPNFEAVLRNDEKKLAAMQEKAKHENLDCLPTLSVSDIPRKGERYQLHGSHISKIPVQWRMVPTNGLTYFRAFQHFKDIPLWLRAILPLYCDALFRLGTPTMTVEMIEDKVRQLTGGLSASYHLAPHHSNLDFRNEGILFTGYCLDRNVPEMLELLGRLINETSWHRVSKLRTIVQGIAANSLNGLAESGHIYAKNYASHGFTAAAWVGQESTGMAQQKLITEMARTENYFPAVTSLKSIGEFAGSTVDMRVAVTCEQKSSEANTFALEKFFSTLRSKAPHEMGLGFQTPRLPHGFKTFFEFPFQVSYVSTCMKTVPFTHKDAPALQILANLLTHKYAHHEIREKGGAYGGGAVHGDGVFGFYSYRDPNPQNSLKVMAQAGDFALSRKWTAQDLEEAKLSIFQGVDAPKSVSQEGMRFFLDGIDDSMRQKFREGLLDCSVNDILDVAERYVAKAVKDNMHCSAILGNKKEWITEADGWEIKKTTEDEGSASPHHDVKEERIRL